MAITPLPDNPTNAERIATLTSIHDEVLRAMTQNPGRSSYKIGDIEISRARAPKYLEELREQIRALQEGGIPDDPAENKFDHTKRHNYARIRRSSYPAG